MKMYRGDLKPDLVITLMDGDTPIDLSAATSVSVVGVRDGATLFDRAATSATSAGVVTMAWQAADTNTAGAIEIEVEVVWPGGKAQTFRPRSMVTIEPLVTDAAVEAAAPGALATLDAFIADLVADSSSAAGASLAATIVGTRNTPARGRIAIEIDDAQPSHFAEILPMTLRHGVPFGTAWPTNNGNDALVRQAWEAGWEVMAHGHDHENMTTLTEAQLRAISQAQLDKVWAITGSDEVAFVYPAHQRNGTTDRILSEFFTRARGRAEWEGVPNNGDAPWLVAAAPLDPEFDGTGGISARLRNALYQIAHADGQLLFYAHYNNNTLNPGAVASLEALIVLARSLGIQIVKPSELFGSSLVTPDPFLRDNAGANTWTLDAAFSLSSDYGLRGGQSLKFTPNAVGGSWRHGQARRTAYLPHFVKGTGFSVLRASLRYKATAAVTVSAAWGLSRTIIASRRPVSGGDQAIATLDEFGTRFAGAGGVIPAADWARVSRVLVLGPDVSKFTAPWVNLTNVAEGSPPIYFSDIRLDRIDSAPSMTYTPTLNGTAGVSIPTGIYQVSRYGVAVTPLASTAGRVYVSAPGADVLTIKSTDAADTTQQVRVTVTPTTGYDNLTLSELGG